VPLASHPTIGARADGAARTFSSSPFGTHNAPEIGTARSSAHRWPARFDAVLAGTYEDKATGTVDSLLFGLYGDDGLLHFIGHSRVYRDAAEIATLLEPLERMNIFQEPK
jgi:predicted PhzF superfamily epimerase YddE/YHI9